MEGAYRNQSTDKNRGRLKGYVNTLEHNELAQNLPSRIIKSCSWASSSTAFLRSSVAVAPVGLHPNGTVYRALGLGFPSGQFFKMSRKQSTETP